jgi:hypothetical protein
MEFPEVIVGYEWASGSELGVIIRPNTVLQQKGEQLVTAICLAATGWNNGRQLHFSEWKTAASLLLFVCLELVNLMSGLALKTCDQVHLLRHYKSSLDASMQRHPRLPPEIFFKMKQCASSPTRPKVSFSTEMPVSMLTVGCR